MIDTPHSTERLVRNPRVRHRAVGEDGVVVQLDNGRVLVVNEVGLRIVELLGEPRSRTELVDCLTAEFEVSPDQAGADLDRYLAELDAEQVLGTDNPDSAK